MIEQIECVLKELQLAVCKLIKKKKLGFFGDIHEFYNKVGSNYGDPSLLNKMLKNKINLPLIKVWTGR